jgi:uncharacterized membrane protein YoaT (DUF817 family)
MTFSLSRVLSLLVVAAAYIRAYWFPSGFWIVTLVSGALLALIWFPEQIDDISFGTWSKGNQIDTHTPGVAIAALGWILLLLFAVVLFLARIPSKP